jgi:hypothetical protein
MSLLVVSLLTLTGCPSSQVGARCREQFGQNSTHVLVCKNGRWTRGATKVDVVRFLVAVANARATTTTATPVRVDPTIDQLTVASESSMAGYDRDLFGSGWAQVDGCDTRARVLIATSTAAVSRTPSCTITKGWWVSLYDGYSTPDPTELHIDHVVAVAEAWRSGASQWDPARRRQFYNDMANLLAVTASENLRKGDKDPATWQPSSDAAWCRFTSIYIATKVRWALTVDQAERTALVNMRTRC